MSIHPEVLWAQRSSTSEPEKNIIYLTVNVPDIVQDSLECNLTSTSISFKAKNVKCSDGKTYAFDLDFFSEIDTEHSVKKFTSRSLSFVLRKKELKEEYWPRLTKEKVRNAFLKTDFSKWVDEDEQEGVAVETEDMDPMGMGGMGGMPPGMDFEKMMAQMGGMGGMDGGMGGAGPSGAGADNDDDSDDDGPPPLEDAEPPK
ncbi:HSP20-like chaperone [Mucidula mucida]|nr:HSP20-like chaperone [Mucidula mucida]